METNNSSRDSRGQGRVPTKTLADNRGKGDEALCQDEDDAVELPNSSDREPKVVAVDTEITQGLHQDTQQAPNTETLPPLGGA